MAGSTAGRGPPLFIQSAILQHAAACGTSGPVARPSKSEMRRGLRRVLQYRVTDVVK